MKLTKHYFSHSSPCLYHHTLKGQMKMVVVVTESDKCETVVKMIGY